MDARMRRAVDRAAYRVTREYIFNFFIHFSLYRCKQIRNPSLRCGNMSDPKNMSARRHSHGYRRRVTHTGRVRWIYYCVLSITRSVIIHTEWVDDTCPAGAIWILSFIYVASVATVSFPSFPVVCLTWWTVFYFIICIRLFWEAKILWN